MSTQKLRIGIISFAQMHAHSYARALAADSSVEFIGISDSYKSRGEEMARSFETACFADESSLLAQKLDGVIITSENVYHRKYTELAAKSGVKAILCEKPIATTIEDAKAMIDACKERKVHLAIAFPCRYSPALKRLRQQVQSGEIGDVLAIRGTNHGKMPGGWFVDRSLSGGGAVLDHTVHVADLNRWILKRDAITVYAEIGSGFTHQDFDDTGFLNIGYDGGVFATLDTSWSRPQTYPTWGDVTLQVVGTGGVLELDLFAQSLAHYDGRTGATAWPGWGSNIDAGLIADFLKLAGGQVASDIAKGEDGLKALAVALAAYRSADEGAPVLV